MNKNITDFGLHYKQAYWLFLHFMLSYSKRPKCLNVKVDIFAVANTLKGEAETMRKRFIREVSTGSALKTRSSRLPLKRLSRNRKL